MMKKTIKKFYIITTSDFPDNTLFRHASFIKAAGFEPVFVFPLSYNEKNFKKFYSNYKTVRLNFKFNSTGILNYSRSICQFLLRQTSYLVY
jgi:hypothetical protein